MCTNFNFHNFIVSIPILLMEAGWKKREVKLLAQGHTVGQQESRI